MKDNVNISDISKSFEDAFHEALSIKVTMYEGFVAFMDILGFSSISKIDAKLAGLIFGIMNSTRGEKEEIVAVLSDQEEEIFDQKNLSDKQVAIDNIRQKRKLVRDNIAIALISDSIVCVANLKNHTNNEQAFITQAYVSILGSIVSTMFNNGLPLRGGVAYGSFFANAELSKNPNAFLGDAILAAHKLEKYGETACVRFEEDAAKICLKHIDCKANDAALSSFANLCVSDVTFVKSDGTSAKSKDLRPDEFLCINIHNMEQHTGREQKYTIDSFSAHNKCKKEGKNSDEVEAKIKNTILFLGRRRGLAEFISKKQIAYKEEG